LVQLVQPFTELQAEHEVGPQAVFRFAATQQLLLQVAPMGQAAVSWQVCGHVAVPLTQLPLEQMVFSGQSWFCWQPGEQRGWLGSAVLHPCVSGQSLAETHPGLQLFDPSGLGWQICPLAHSESCEQSERRKQALARHW
jgi:hypothetical protein